MKRLVDQTGRPGPSTWEAGHYPEGRADHPVAGVSWYEADAYARFRGKRLPNVFQWSHAARFDASGAIIAASNIARVREGTSARGVVRRNGRFGCARHGGQRPRVVHQ